MSVTQFSWCPHAAPALVALGDIRRLLYGTETSATPTHERASLRVMCQMILTPGNTYVYPSTFGRQYIFPLVSAHARQLRGMWVVDFD